MDSWDWSLAVEPPPSAAVTARGAARVVWADRQVVKSAIRGPAGPWSEPRTLFRSSSANPDGPQIAVDGRGGVVVAWAQGRSVWAIRRPAGGTWSRPHRIATAPKQQSVVSHIDLAVGKQGTALVAFWRGHVRPCRSCFDDFTVNNVKAVAVVRPPAGHWSAPFTFAGPIDRVHGWCNPSLGPGSYCLVRPPAGVVYDGGTVTVGWSHPGYMQTGPAYVRTKPPGSTWHSRMRLTPDGREVSQTPLLAATTWGQLTAAWNSLRNKNSRFGSIRSRTKPAGGSWGAVERVARRGELSGLGVDDTGAATVLYERAKTESMSTMTRPRWGTWGARTTIGPGGWGATLAVDPTGEAVAAWQSDGVVLASWRNSSAPWPKAARLGVGATPRVTAAIGEDDTAVVVWYRYRGSDLRYIALKGSVHPGRR